MTARSRALRLVAGSLVLLSSLAGVGLICGVRVNLTPSYPLGVWRIEALTGEVAAGNRIFICPPPSPEFVAARKRGYLSHGLCPGGFAPLIKTVVAVAGQSVVIASGIAVDGRILPHSYIQRVDGTGRRLTPATGGVVPDGQVFVFSQFRGSYDSRYFGPIPVAGVLGLARPLLVFDP